VGVLHDSATETEVQAEVHSVRAYLSALPRLRRCQLRACSLGGRSGDSWAVLVQALLSGLCCHSADNVSTC
jgi:hypothetical protein